MAVNKVVFGDETLIDLTTDTVTAGSMPSGTKAHSKSGEVIYGNARTYTPTTPADHRISIAPLSKDGDWMRVYIANPGFYQSGSSLRFSAANLGEATIYDVREGVTFSSKYGANLTGQFVGAERVLDFCDNTDGHIATGGVVRFYTPSRPISIVVESSGGYASSVSWSNLIPDRFLACYNNSRSFVVGTYNSTAQTYYPVIHAVYDDGFEILVHNNANSRKSVYSTTVYC